MRGARGASFGSFEKRDVELAGKQSDDDYFADIFLGFRRHIYLGRVTECVELTSHMSGNPETGML